MARLPKPLEEQLFNTREEIQRTKDKLAALEQKEKDILQAIDDRDMRDSFALLKDNNISVDELKRILALRNQIEEPVAKTKKQ